MAAINSHARKRTVAELEIDGVREAIRLNWLELERSTLSEVDRRAIRANVAHLVQTLAQLLAQSGHEFSGPPPELSVHLASKSPEL